MSDALLTMIPAERMELGTFIDCNMASAWVDGKLRLFPGKYGEDPLWGDYDELKWPDGANALEAFAHRPEEYTRCALPPNAPVGTPGLHGAVWFESIYCPSADGQRLFALYHNENYPRRCRTTRPPASVTGTSTGPPACTGTGRRRQSRASRSCGPTTAA